jgi:hypothetical protein
MKTRGQLIIMITIAFFCFCSLYIISAQHGGLTRLSSSQSDYPILPEGDGLLSFERIERLETLCFRATLIIKGEIIERLPKVTKTIIPAPGSPESKNVDKAKLDAYLAESYPIRILIEDVIKGSGESAGSKIQLMVSAMIIDACPDMQKGDGFVFFLYKQTTTDNYVQVGLHDGYFYYAADNKVYPAEVQPYLANTSGMGYADFKKLIQNCVADP